MGQVNNSKVGEKEVKANTPKVRKKEVNTANSDVNSELESGKK